MGITIDDESYWDEDFSSVFLEEYFEEEDFTLNYRGFKELYDHIKSVKSESIAYDENLFDTMQEVLTKYPFIGVEIVSSFEASIRRVDVAGFTSIGRFWIDDKKTWIEFKSYFFEKFPNAISINIGWGGTGKELWETSNILMLLEDKGKEIAKLLF